jgi:uncharacterized protein YjbI with pentapeptide repeats
MSNPEHLARLTQQGVMAWNEWRGLNKTVEPDLSGADLSNASLSGADLSNANLAGANLSEANLTGANLNYARLTNAVVNNADLRNAYLSKANLSEAYLIGVNLSGANLSSANLHHASLGRSNLYNADLTDADLSRAYLFDTNLGLVRLVSANLNNANLACARLTDADLKGADLRGAYLHAASFLRTNLEGADLTGCDVYGISVWDARLEGAKQSNLIITPDEEPAIQVDNLEVAQFIYLLLSNAKIRHVIDTITSKVVLILGRFTRERKLVLDAIREELRKHDCVPVLFDFEKPVSKDLTGTISTLANMARFIIADLTEPSSVPHELATLIPNTIVPVQPILLKGQREYAMFGDLWKRHPWVLKPYRYESSELLMANLAKRVIAPGNLKAEELKRKFAANNKRKL